MAPPSTFERVSTQFTACYLGASFQRDPAFRRIHMTAKRQPIEYADASAEVRAVYDDIMATRKTDWINNFWKAIAHDPATLKRTWENIKQIMAPGALDPLTKEMIYIAVSVTNQCAYCIASHTVGAQKKGMTDAMFKELIAVIGMANETNKMVTGYQVEIDEQFRSHR
jgi:AhpD family alkylhydroperoxidase